MSERFLKSAVWNIEGLSSDKISDPHFLQSISKFHIVSFVETWGNDLNDDLNLQNFHLIASSCRKKHKKARRNSGGISIFVKNQIVKGIKKLPKNHSDILWIKLVKTFFNFNRDIYLATIYIYLQNIQVFMKMA